MAATAGGLADGGAHDREQRLAAGVSEHAQSPFQQRLAAQHELCLRPAHPVPATSGQQHSAGFGKGRKGFGHAPGSVSAGAASRSASLWIGPAVVCSGLPVPPQREPMISAAIDTAVSLGRARADVEADRRVQPGQLGFGQPAFAQPLQALGVSAPAAHRTDVTGIAPQGHLEQRHVELLVVREHADHRARVDRPGGDAAGQVAMRPLDDDLVGIGKAALGGEQRAGVADRHPVAEEDADPGHGGGEIDRAEDQHPGRRGVGGDEDCHVVLATLAPGPIVALASSPGGEPAAGVVGDGDVEPAGAEGSGDLELGDP